MLFALIETPHGFKIVQEEAWVPSALIHAHLKWPAFSTVQEESQLALQAL